MGTVLDRIVARKAEEVLERKRRRPIEDVKRAAGETPRPRNFYSAIAADPPRGIHLIAEVKKASPSAGLIRDDFDPQTIARIYHEAGASAISCLTDEPFFQGRLEYIEQIKGVVPLPVLRKDFMIDEYQIYEARAVGADAILLIADILRPQQVLDWMILATELNLTVLLEVHDADTLLQVRSVIGFPHRRYSLLGINNRDLKTQTIDLATTSRLAELVEDETLLVSESGVRTREDVLRLQRAGARALLIGETLMRADDIAGKIEELFGPAS
ncbi:MAG: indole-3-glycerol phosphate synthase TrpC [Phycisphaerae bacterium]|nr:indole-3-glycerol phosphate synthase TrpC [Phycisphaerae bacterium]